MLASGFHFCNFRQKASAYYDHLNEPNHTYSLMACRALARRRTYRMRHRSCSRFALDLRQGPGAPSTHAGKGPPFASGENLTIRSGNAGEIPIRQRRCERRRPCGRDAPPAGKDRASPRATPHPAESRTRPALRLLEAERLTFTPAKREIRKNYLSTQNGTPCRTKARLAFRMLRYFQLERPEDKTIQCDSRGCDAKADFVAIQDDGTEYYLCTFHAMSKNRVLRLTSSA